MWVGDRIYFISERNFPVNIWSCKPDGSDAKQITKHTDYDVRSIDTDGKKIVYIDARRHLGAGSGNRQVESRGRACCRAIASASAPRVEDASKSSKASTCQQRRQARRRRSCAADLDCRPPSRADASFRLTDNDSASAQCAAVYSPDGKKVACISDETGEQEIAIYDAARQGQTHKIAHQHGKGWLFSPIWSD